MPVTPAPAPEIPLPPEPQSVEQTGLTVGFLADLALKTLYLRGQMTMSELATALGLPIANVTDKVMEFLKAERLVEIRGGTGLSSAGYQFVIVDRGSEKAQEGAQPEPVRGEGPGPTRDLRRRGAAADGEQHHRLAGGACPRVRAHGHPARDAWSARSGDQLGKIDLPLRPAG